jgi:2-dehydro-3-deoxygluconokinase
MSDAPRIVTFGEAMALLRTREIGSMRHATDVAVGIGGAESNVAIGLSRLGVDASWLGRVGDDPLGERVVREIRAEGVDVRALVDTEASTGLMLKERPTTASTRVRYYRSGSAGSRLQVDDLPHGWIEHADILHVTGITALLSDTARACLAAAIERARAAGTTVSFDVNYRSALAAPEVAGPLLRTLAERADIVFGGDEELELLFPSDDAAVAARRLLDAGCREVVRKRGADGATAVTSDGAVDAPGFVIDVVDTVGAGDAFVAGYLSARVEGGDVASRLRRGNVCGALACTAPGDWESNPTVRDVERFGDTGVDPVAR